MQVETYPKGNFDSYLYTLSVYLPEGINFLRRTAIPAFEASLFQLVGNTREFSKHEGTMKLELNEEGIPSKIRAHICYAVPSFKVQGISQDAVVSDRSFILGKLRKIKQLEKLPEESVDLDTDSGEVSFTFEIPLRAAVPVEA